MKALKRHLRELGLTEYETNAYLTLLEKGMLTASKCSASSGVPRPRCYDVLRSLMEKGLVKMEPGRPTRYAVNPPEIGLRNLYKNYKENMERELETKERSVRLLSSQLSQIYNRETLDNIEEYVWVSKEDFNPLSYVEMLSEASSMFYIVTPYSESIDREKHFYTTLLNALKRGLEIKLIQPISGIVNFTSYDKLVDEGMQIKHILNPYGFFSISDDGVSIRLIKNKQYVGSVRIKDDFTKHMFMDYFMKVWDSGKPYKEMKKLYKSIDVNSFNFKINLPQNARIHYYEETDHEGYVEFYIPLRKARGYLSVFWGVNLDKPLKQIINGTLEKIRIADVQIGRIKDLRKTKIAEGRWKNLVLGTGPIKYTIMERNYENYILVQAINAEEDREIEREAMIALDIIAKTFNP